jgi:acyl-CoA thioesterase I
MRNQLLRLITVFLGLWFMWGQALASSTTILALGDSLTAGYGLPPGEALPDKLQEALKAEGLDITIINAGVSGDIAAQGAARLDWALTDDVKAVIVELGANDALRGLPPQQADAALREILQKLKTKNLPVLLLGMKAPPNLGEDYGKAFDGMYAKLATEFGVALYPFYLDGVAAQADLNQPDGIHPNEKGVAVIVPRLVPYVKKLIAK